MDCSKGVQHLWEIWVPFNKYDVTSEEYFTDSYIEEVFESKDFRTSNK